MICSTCGYNERHGVIFGQKHGELWVKAFACERCIWKGFLWFNFKRATVDGYNLPLLGDVYEVSDHV